MSRTDQAAPKAVDLEAHPIQYALVSVNGGRHVVVLGTEALDDDGLRQHILSHPGGAPLSTLEMLLHPTAYPIRAERYNRCPNCEQWSPCDKRNAALAGRTAP